MANHGLDRRATSEFALDGTEHAALQTGDEDAMRVGGVVAAIILVDCTMVCKRHVSYLRVSTNKRDQNGLGVEAQRGVVQRYLFGHHGE